MAIKSENRLYIIDELEDLHGRLFRPTKLNLSIG